jgi:hypothetical protein
MGAPATTAITTPAGIKLCDGFASLVMFAADTDISLWVKSVTPPSVDGGDSIDITDMHNTTFRTMCARSLLTLGELSFTAAFDPDAYDETITIINLNDSITVHFPDLSTLDFWGFLRMFEPQEMSEGDQPVANCTVTATNFDTTNNVEAAPVMTEVAGT